MYQQLLFAALLTTASLACDAVQVTIAYEGTLVFSSMPGITSGDTVRGQISFDSSTPDALIEPTQGYYIAPGTFSVEVGSFVRTDSLDWIWVYDNYGNSPSDQFRAEGFEGEGTTYYWFRLDLYADGSTLPLTSDALPGPSLNYQLFDVHRVELQTNSGSASFEISRLDVVSVPEPPPITLLALAGLIAISTQRFHYKRGREKKRLTGRSTGAPTAWHLARAAQSAYHAPRGPGAMPSVPG